MAVISQRTYKIAHIHTNISIWIVDELTCNIPKNFVQDIVFYIPDINLSIWSGFCNHVKKYHQSHQAVQPYEVYIDSYRSANSGQSSGKRRFLSFVLLLYVFYCKSRKHFVRVKCKLVNIHACDTHHVANFW